MSTIDHTADAVADLAARAVGMVLDFHAHMIDLVFTQPFLVIWVAMVIVAAVGIVTTIRYEQPDERPPASDVTPCTSPHREDPSATRPTE